MRISRILEGFVPYRMARDALDSRIPIWERLLDAVGASAILVAIVALVMTLMHKHEDVADIMRFVASTVVNGIFYILVLIVGIQVLMRGVRSPNKTYRIGCTILAILLVLTALVIVLQLLFGR